MTTIEIFLKNGKRMTEDVETFSVEELTNNFNDNGVLLVPVGKSFINKNTVKLVAPTTQTTIANYKIFLHDGKEIATYIEDASNLEANLNNLKVAMSALGDVMVDKRDINAITPIQ
jgi:sRNA-binding regulator protein Hfq